MSGDAIENDKIIDFEFDPIDDCNDQEFQMEVISEGHNPEKGFSIWLTQDRRPVMQTLPAPQTPTTT